MMELFVRKNGISFIARPCHLYSKTKYVINSFHKLLVIGVSVLNVHLDGLPLYVKISYNNLLVFCLCLLKIIVSRRKQLKHDIEI